MRETQPGGFPVRVVLWASLTLGHESAEWLRLVPIDDLEIDRANIVHWMQRCLRHLVVGDAPCVSVPRSRVTTLHEVETARCIEPRAAPRHILAPLAIFSATCLGEWNRGFGPTRESWPSGVGCESVLSGLFEKPKRSGHGLDVDSGLSDHLGQLRVLDGLDQIFGAVVVVIVEAGEKPAAVLADPFDPCIACLSWTWSTRQDRIW